MHIMTNPCDLKVHCHLHTVGIHSQHFRHLLHHVCKSSQIHFEFRPFGIFLSHITSCIILIIQLEAGQYIYFDCATPLRILYAGMDELQSYCVNGKSTNGSPYSGTATIIPSISFVIST